MKPAFGVASWLLVLTGASACKRTSSWAPASTNFTDAVAVSSLGNQLAAFSTGSLQTFLEAAGVESSCTTSEINKRREYSTLSNEEKLAYTDAVLCLMDAPTKIPESECPGCRSRYDDFVATHINQTEQIHFTASFLFWHRYFMWSFERALRDECGYQGYLPYWNWGKSALDPLNSPYFDGSAYSQGGNGIWSPHNCTAPVPGGWYCTPVIYGQGGGCVETGPYAGRLCNISATMPSLQAVDAPVAGVPLSYGPRCVRRDISQNLTATFSTDDKHYDLLTNYPTLGAYQDRLQGLPFSLGDPGQHGAGHFTWAGDPGMDVYNTPNDMMFWLHHCGIDRSWWLWQNQDVFGRALQVNGTLTMFDTPPSADGTLDDILDMYYITPNGSEPSPMRDHVSTLAGSYCYVYE